MGLFDRFLSMKNTGKSSAVVENKDASLNPDNSQDDSNTTQRMSSKDFIEMMMDMAEIALEKGDYEHAVETYKHLLELEPNSRAQYNLGSLCAQGKGTVQDFKEGAYWFHQAEMAGDEKAGKLCMKCATDFVHRNFDMKTPEQLYSEMLGFVKFVFPETTDYNLETCRKLYVFGGNHLNKKEFFV